MRNIYFISEEFDNYMQQDAHEFLNFLINHINEIILGKHISINIRAHADGYIYSVQYAYSNLRKGSFQK